MKSRRLVDRATAVPAELQRHLATAIGIEIRAQRRKSSRRSSLDHADQLSQRDRTLPELGKSE